MGSINFKESIELVSKIIDDAYTLYKKEDGYTEEKSEMIFKMENDINNLYEKTGLKDRTKRMWLCSYHAAALRLIVGAANLKILLINKGDGYAEIEDLDANKCLNALESGYLALRGNIAMCFRDSLKIKENRGKKQ